MQLVLAVLAIFVALPVSAQRLPAEGTPVIATTDSGRIEGVVHRRASDSLWIRDPDARLRVLPRGEIGTMSTYGTQWGRGAKRGAIVGGIVGALGLGVAVWADTHPTNSECICIPASLVVAPIAVALPVVGAGVGLLFAPQGWSKPRRY